MLRRAFLGSAAAGLRAQGPPPSSKIVSSVVLRWLPGRFEEKLAVVARAGVQSVELSDELTPLAPARRLLRSYNLAVNAISSTSAELAKQLDLARELDASTVFLETGRTDDCRRAGDLAGRAGVTLLVDGLQLVKDVAHPQVRLRYDVFQEHGKTPLEDAAPYIKLLHVADSPDRREPGAGSLPFNSIYKTLLKAGFEGHVAMAYRPTGDPAASLIRAVDALRKSLAP
jgi:sugar phosphate isomerase/epimerase